MTKSLVALVGMKHRKTEALVASLPQGEPLVLVREPNNDFDQNAVQVWARDQHVGYVKATQARPIAMAMDAATVAGPGRVHPSLALHNKTGRPALSATLSIDGGKWPMAEIDLAPPRKEPPDVG